MTIPRSGIGIIDTILTKPIDPPQRGRAAVAIVLGAVAKALDRQEFVVGRSDPEGTPPHHGALLLGYFTDEGKLIHTGRVGTGMSEKVLADLRCRLEPPSRAKPPLNVLPPRKTRFGLPLVLSRVHWVEPKLVTEVTYLTWTTDNHLRHAVYVGYGRTSRPISYGGK